MLICLEVRSGLVAKQVVGCVLAAKQGQQWLWMGGSVVVVFHEMILQIVDLWKMLLHWYVWARYEVAVRLSDCRLMLAVVQLVSCQWI